MNKHLKGIDIKTSRKGYKYEIKGEAVMNPHKGLFICIDHPDGAGASTLSRKIIDFLESTKKQAFFTEEPTNEMFGGLIRSTLRHRIDIDLATMQLLFTVDRIDHIRTIVEPKLKEGATVVQSRYFLSTLMYAYKELDLGFLLAPNAYAIWPDINFVITNVHPKTSISRIKKRIEGTEKFDNRDKLTKVNESIDILSTLFPKFTYKIDGSKSIEEVAKQAIEIIKKHPKYKKL